MIKKLEEYAELALKIGVNIQEGQKLFISTPIHAVEFVRVITKKAYEMGVKDVIYSWNDDVLSYTRFKNIAMETLEEFPEWTIKQMEDLAEGQAGSQPFNGVGYKNHPRGLRTGFFQWDFPGLQSAVYLDGTINDSSDRDRGWTVELALPWAGMDVLAKGDKRNVPPEDHDVWRMDFSRFNQYKEAPPANDPGGWAWSPHGVWDSHVPECFTYIHFSLADVLIVD